MCTYVCAQATRERSLLPETSLSLPSPFSAPVWRGRRTGVRTSRQTGAAPLLTRGTPPLSTETHVRPAPATGTGSGSRAAVDAGGSGPALSGCSLPMFISGVAPVAAAGSGGAWSADPSSASSPLRLPPPATVGAPSCTVPARGQPVRDRSVPTRPELGHTRPGHAPTPFRTSRPASRLRSGSGGSRSGSGGSRIGSGGSRSASAGRFRIGSGGSLVPSRRSDEPCT